LKFTIDVDCGGTFTDAFVSQGNEFDMVKVSTTPHDLTVCFWEIIEESARRNGLSAAELLSQTELVRFSTTTGTNTLIQKNGPRIGLIVTEGNSANLYQTENELQKLLGFIDPEMVAEIKEGVDTEGNVLGQPEPSEVLEKVEGLLDSGARYIVVCLQNAAKNPINEIVLKKILESEYPKHYLGAIPALLSSKASTASNDGERLVTSVLNAYIHPDMLRFLYKADEMLRQQQFRHPLLVGHASGGAARVAKTKALQTYNSGPAAGMLGAVKVAHDYHLDYLVTADMGGTSLDMGLVKHGKPIFTMHSDVVGLQSQLLAIEVETFGAGGGSIATILPSRTGVQVGPRSAGSAPGPAAFGLGGTEPTVTDANVVLGIVNPDWFLGGRMKLSREKAAQAIESRLAKSMNITVEEAAWKIKVQVEEDIGTQLRDFLLRKGVEPGSSTILAYGGAGPMHCCGFADVAGVKKILIYPFSPVFSAYGLSTADIVHIYERINNTEFGLDSETLAQDLAEMQQIAFRDMRGEGVPADSVAFELELYMSDGTWHSTGINLSNPADLSEQCKKAAASVGSNKVEYLILRASSPVSHWPGNESPLNGTDPVNAFKQKREIFSNGSWTAMPVFEREKLEPGNIIQGPAIVEASDTTYVLPEEWVLTVDKRQTCILERK
jgi:N-methylhydantoinase A/acetophenone carboxylase